jgi:hypothetical protein
MTKAVGIVYNGIVPLKWVLIAAVPKRLNNQTGSCSSSYASAQFRIEDEHMEEHEENNFQTRSKAASELAMSKSPLSTRPLTSSETVLRDKFAESLVGQSELMDKVAQQLITLELAIPGLYATVLKLIAGEKGTVAVNNWVYGSFGCWFLALLFTLVSLFPRQWEVDPTVLRAGVNSKVLGLEDFYYRSARYKFWLLIPSAILFALGILCAAVWVFQTPPPGP